jgi:hypothetical protein
MCISIACLVGLVTRNALLDANPTNGFIVRYHKPHSVGISSQNQFMRLCACRLLRKPVSKRFRYAIQLCNTEMGTRDQHCFVAQILVCATRNSVPCSAVATARSLFADLNFRLADQPRERRHICGTRVIPQSARFGRRSRTLRANQGAGAFSACTTGIGSARSAPCRRFLAPPEKFSTLRCSME